MFTVTATSPDDIATVWSRVSDLTGHADGVPFTSSASDPGPPGIGWRFSARTGVGPLGFEDPMVVTAWEPPRRIRVEKTGRILAGWADITLTETAGGGTEVTWREEVLPAHRGLARMTRPAFDAAGSLVFGRALRRILNPA